LPLNLVVAIGTEYTGLWNKARRKHGALVRGVSAGVSALAQGGAFGSAIQATGACGNLEYRHNPDMLPYPEDCVPVIVRL
jgi:hypothetical protein